MTDPVLISVIEQTESARRTNAVRFEPLTYQHIGTLYSRSLHNCVVANRCSEDTAKMICSTSWGAFQLMGFNIYADNAPCLDMSIVTFANNFACQQSAIEYFLTSIGQKDVTWEQMKLSEQVRNSFISKYNGPGAIDAYWFRMVSSAKYLNL